MPDAPAGRITAFAAVFAVENVPASLAFYRDRLGFTARFTLGDPPSYAIIERGPIELHLMPPGDKDRQGGQPAGQSSIYAYSTGLDRLHAALLAQGCPIEVPPQDFPYGMREFSVRDPDGNRVTFGQEI